MKQQPNLASNLHLELPNPVDVSAPLDIARQAILSPSGLDEDRIANVLGSVEWGTASITPICISN